MTTRFLLKFSLGLLTLVWFAPLCSAQDHEFIKWEKSYDNGMIAMDSLKFDVAVGHLEKSYEISSKFSEKYLLHKANTDFYLGKAYNLLNRKKEAVPLLIESVDLYSVYPENQDSILSERMIFTASICSEIGSYNDAIANYENALKIIIANNNESLYCANIMGDLAMTYRSNGNFNKAYDLIKNSLSIIEKNVGKNHLDYAKRLNNLGAISKSKGYYDEAQNYVLESLSIYQGISDYDFSDYSRAVTNLNQIYAITGDYSKAIKVQKELISQIEERKVNDISYASAVYTLSYLYHNIAEFEEEINILNEVETLLGDNSPYLPNVYNNLGQAYDRLGNYERSLYFTKKSINLTPKGHPSLGTRLQNLAYLYNNLGEREKTLEYYNAARQEMEQTYGKLHNTYGQLLNNIGKYHFSIGNYTEAKNLFKEALDIFLINFDENHERYSYQLNDYATSLLKLGQENRAIELMQKNIDLAISNDRLDTETYYKSQFNLAKAYNSLENYEMALPLLNSATENIKSKLTDEHPYYGRMLKSLGETYIGLNDLEKALPAMETSNDLLIKELDQIFKFRSEAEKKAFLDLVIQHFDEMQSIRNGDMDKSNSWDIMNLNNQLMLKGLLLNNSKNVIRQLRTLDNIDIQIQLDDYSKNKRLLAKTSTQSISIRTKDPDSLRLVINDQESELVKLYNENFGEVLKLKRDWTLPKAAMGQDAVAIEFTNYKLTQNSRKTDSVIYAAYIYKGSWETPKFIRLFEERRLLQFIRNTKPDQLYMREDLFDLIWKPLKPFISKRETVYFSPSGLLNQIQISGIRDNKGDVLGKSFKIVQLSSTDILTNGITEPRLGSVLFIGGIDYDTASSDSTDVAQRSYEFLDSEVLKNKRATRSRGESWDYLNGTMNEINGLKSLFETNNRSYKVLTGTNASEANFKALDGNSPNILHIATHGFFYENLNLDSVNEFNLTIEDQYRLAKDPLLRSGLILAGANIVWKGTGLSSNQEDGILSAMEISNLDLSNTDIVVLSACETGLGDIDGSEGVYGLQRAFKMAGVDIVVMSLWQVEDEETAEFMNHFYTEWLKTKQVRKAFTTTQRVMQKKYKNEPSKWAAFVLFE